MMTEKEIAFEAKKQGICKEWFARMLKQNGIKPFCEMYFAGSDWAMEHDFPSLPILRQFKGQSEKYGLYTDYASTFAGSQKMAFFGKSEAEITAGGYDVQEIYVRHESRAKITAAGRAYVVVNVLDDAKVEITCGEQAEVVVYCFGKLDNITAGSGNVRVIKSDFDK